MLLNANALKTALLCAGKNDARYMLNGLKIETDGSVIGTDGHILAIVSPQIEHEEKDYPAIPGYTMPETETSLTPCAIERAGIEKLLKASAKPHKAWPILQNVVLDTAQTNTNGKAIIHTASDLDNPQTLNLAKLDGTFPNYQQVFPKDEPVYRIYFDAEILGQLCQAAQTLHGKNLAVLELEFFSNGLGPMKATTKNKAGQSATFLAMPIRGEKPTGTLQPKTEEEAVS